MKKLVKLSLAVIGMTAMMACNSNSEQHKSETEATETPATQEATTPAPDSTITPVPDSTHGEHGHSH